VTLTRSSLGNPVAVAVAVILAIVFGLISLERLPIQLTPEVEKPEISITTNWRSAAPEEIESEIIEQQEKVLRGLPGMTELLSTAQQGRGRVSITFLVGTNIERALLEVLNRLNRVPRYPDDADEPIISTIGGETRAIAWFILKPLPGNNNDIVSYKNYIEEVVQTRFERVPGVAQSEIRGGREREVQIVFDPYKAASLGVNLNKAAQLAGGNKDVSGGDQEVGKRRYNLRFAGKFDVDSIGDMVVEWREGHPILLRDIATIEIGFREREGFVIANGENAIAVNAHRENGVNVLDVMAGLKEAMEELRDGPLVQAGLSITQVYDETIYIDRSISMVRNNMLLGIILAIGVLWWFLRQFRATLMVAVAIPVCLVVSFSFLDLTSHSLNVISLAGLALAMGMVLDAAIVVLENIVRLREKGKQGKEASDLGTSQVWGALLASTATTVAIFLPIVFLEDVAGQLFADLAVAIAVAISASLIIAITVIPTSAMKWLRDENPEDPHKHWWNRIANGVMSLTDTVSKRAFWIAGLICGSIVITWALFPQTEYLPVGKRNLAFAFINMPPGANITYLEKEMGNTLAERMKPYLEGGKEPQIKNYFFVARANRVFMGVRAKDETKTDEVVDLLNGLMSDFPDTIAFAKQSSLFGRMGGGRTISVNLQARNIESLLGAAQTGYALIQEVIPGSKIQPHPGLELAEPELQFVPDERRIAEAGWNRQVMARLARALGDGLYIGDYFDGEERLDMILRAESWQTPEELSTIPLYTPDAGILPVDELMAVKRTAGPSQVRRLDRRRTITLVVSPPKNISLERALDIVETRVAPVLQGMLPEDGMVRYTGTADKLKAAQKSLSGGFGLAILILYLLMSSLFRSFKDSLLVVLAIPLATVGGVVALKIVNLFTIQHMDLLTMIGFIILLGLVVNNAILLVYQTRNAERNGMSRCDAVAQAVHLRLRPILMSTLTSIFGMLPLLLNPGAGTELYRGLAAVIVGGMSVSTVFTLILLPSLLRIGEDKHLGTGIEKDSASSDKIAYLE